MDLGEAWHQWTGLPMVYATWMCRQEIEDEPRIALAVDLLDRLRRHNAMRLGWIARQRGGEAGWPADRALAYVSNYLKYDVDERAIAGAERFLAEAATAGLLPPWTPRWRRVGVTHTT
jgi:chorismate dehydratase